MTWPNAAIYGICEGKEIKEGNQKANRMGKKLRIPTTHMQNKQEKEGEK